MVLRPTPYRAHACSIRPAFASIPSSVLTILFLKIFYLRKFIVVYVPHVVEPIISNYIFQKFMCFIFKFSDKCKVALFYVKPALKYDKPILQKPDILNKALTKLNFYKIFIISVYLVLSCS